MNDELQRLVKCSRSFISKGKYHLDKHAKQSVFRFLPPTWMNGPLIGLVKAFIPVVLLLTFHQDGWNGSLNWKTVNIASTRRYARR